jgi:hypothetical protein
MQRRAMVALLASGTVAVLGVAWLARPVPRDRASSVNALVPPLDAALVADQALALPQGTYTVRAAAVDPVVTVAEAATDPVTEPRGSVPPADEVDRAIHALTTSLASPAFHWRAFEAQGRALVASLSAPALAELGRPGLASGAEVVARATLIRLAALPLDERRGSSRELVALLRQQVGDDGTPVLEACEAAVALATLGDALDRARLIDDLGAAASPRAREIARTGLGRAGGILEESPSAATELVQSARERNDPDALREALCIATGWLESSGAHLADPEREQCALLLESIAAETTGAEGAPARALAALALADRRRATAVAMSWFADEQRRAGDAAVAANILRDARLDPLQVGALFEQLGDERRAIFAESILVVSAVGQDERTVTLARERARAASLSPSALARRRVVGALTASPHAADRELCAALARTDPDESVRAAAERALRDRVGAACSQGQSTIP